MNASSRFVRTAQCVFKEHLKVGIEISEIGVSAEIPNCLYYYIEQAKEHWKGGLVQRNKI
jgi:hypothetical protein